MKLHADRFVTIEYEESQKQINLLWSDKTDDLTVELYKSEMLIFVGYFLKYTPEKLLNDLSRGSFIVTPDLQLWTVQNVYVHYASIVKKSAIVLSKDFLTQLSVEQIVEEHHTRNFPTKYFSDIKIAKIWLAE